MLNWNSTTNYHHHYFLFNADHIRIVKYMIKMSQKLYTIREESFPRF